MLAFSARNLHRRVAGLELQDLLVYGLGQCKKAHGGGPGLMLSRRFRSVAGIAAFLAFIVTGSGLAGAKSVDYYQCR